MDPTLTAGLIGAVGSITGAVIGTLVGYRLNNSKADVDFYIDNRVWMYYHDHCFSMYVPITVVNEGAKSFTITNFELTLTSPTNQQWKLHWQAFARENSHKGEGWSMEGVASPILVHGRSGTQHYLWLANSDKTSEDLSDVKLQTGKYQLTLSAFNRNTECFKSKTQYLNIGTEPQEQLSKRRSDKKDLSTWWLPVRPNA